VVSTPRISKGPALAGCRISRDLARRGYAGPRPPLSLQTTAECLVTVLLSGAHSGVKHLLGLTCTSQGARGYAEKTRDVHFFRWLRWITQVVCPAPKLLLAISLPQYRPVGRHCGSLRGTDTISHNDVASRCSMKYY